MTSIDIQISGDALAVLPRLKDDAAAGRAIARAMDYQNQLTVARIQAGHLSGPTSDSSLSVRTNRLRASVRASKAVPTANGVVSAIGSNVKYAAIHEFGGVIKRQVKPGAVKLRTDRNGNLLRQGANGRLAIFAGRTHKRFKTVSYAGGKSYEIQIPARAPFGHGIADRADDYGAGISSAIMN
jgi:phage gpG-like protein